MTADTTRLYATIVDLAVDGTHCYLISDKDEQPQNASSSSGSPWAAFPAASYFPYGVLREYQSVTSAVQDRLDRQYRSGKLLFEMILQINNRRAYNLPA